MTQRPTRRMFCELGTASLITGLAGCGGRDDGHAAASSSSGDAGTDTTTAASSTDSTTAETSTGASTSADTEADGTDSSGPSTDPTTGTDEASTGAAACDPSPGSIEGPFHRPNMPIRSDLDLYGDPGIPVHMHGRVLDSDCAPVVNATVELWHASPVAPDAQPGDDDATYDGGRDFRYYGQVATDVQGRYAFRTLQPGWYLNGATYRPAHFHVKVWTRNVERLTTQLYFEGDPFNADDPWFDPTMVLVLAEDGSVERDFVI